MAARRAALASALLSKVLIFLSEACSVASGAEHSGQRLAKPGLSGLSSNSSEQTAQVRRGKAMVGLVYRLGLGE